MCDAQALACWGSTIKLSEVSNEKDALWGNWQVIVNSCKLDWPSWIKMAEGLFVIATLLYNVILGLLSGQSKIPWYLVIWMSMHGCVFGAWTWFLCFISPLFHVTCAFFCAKNKGNWLELLIFLFYFLGKWIYTISFAMLISCFDIFQCVKGWFCYHTYEEMRIV